LRLPSLSEVLTRYQSTAFLDIELKVPGIEPLTADLVRRYVPLRGFVVSSFLPEVIVGLHALDAAIPLGLICETRVELSRWRELPVGYVIPHFALVRQDLVADLRAAGKKILVWTVNLPADMGRFSQLGVDGIISDNPKLLADTFRSQNKSQG
jgi:glycerophosphoryl diester phosphodiesterase